MMKSNEEQFRYADERFADLQVLRYRLNGFERLTLRQKQYVFYLSKAALSGRDITFDQFGTYNLRIRRVLEAIYTDHTLSHDTDDFRALEVYLKRVWFSSGIHHHYGSMKFVPGFSAEYLRKSMHHVDAKLLPLEEGQTVEALFQELRPVIFDTDVLPKRVNKADGQDLIATSACHFYEGVTQQEAEAFYAEQKRLHADDPEPPSFGLNSTLVKREGGIAEDVWHANGRYGRAISKIVYWLAKAADVAENEQQQEVIKSLIAYYETGDLGRFNDYCKKWVAALEGKVDFINGFIEVYGDPLGLKGSWEGLVEYVDEEATRRTELISSNAQWFEDHSPVDPRFRKQQVKGVSAKVICAAMLGGDVILGPISSNDVKFAASIAPYGKRIISPLEPRVAGMSDTMRVVHVPTPAAAQYADAVHWAVADMVPGDSLVLVLQSGKSLTDNASAMVSALRESGVRYAAISYGILGGTRVQAQFNAHAAKYGTTRYLVASEDESFVNDAVRNMNLMVYKKNDVVFYAPSRVRTFSTIETENLHNVSTHISATYYIDYGNPDVQAFVMAYRALFGSEPNSFSFHGYDTMRYFVTMCSRYGRNWFQKLTGQNWKGLQTDFSFEKTYSGQGQVNTAVRRIVYTPEYKTVLQ